MSASDAQLIAFYLPQFHPIPENDTWWGKGFTEWTNVARSVPLYPGHDQPRIPADLGFYDLRLSETRAAQAELARAHGLHGFCYYHYWFSGKRLLERPFNDVLRLGKPDLPFCLCWANETWSRRWLGEEKDILMQQTYSSQDDLAHGHWLANAFADPRYIRVQGRPLFLVYRPMDLPDARRTTDVFRSVAIKAGVSEPYLVAVDAHKPGVDFREMGFDAILNFTPQLGLLEGAFRDGFSAKRLVQNTRNNVFSGDLKIYDYEVAWRAMCEARPRVPHIPTVFVGWDNTPRRGRNGVIIANSSGEKFAKALREVLSSLHINPVNPPLVFINAWNEWAEGNYLEPDLKRGREYLEALRSVIGAGGLSSPRSAPLS
jgi:lipopolysaccharide biosynthesis protein